MERCKNYGTTTLKEQDKPDGDLYDGGQLGGGGEDTARDSVLHQLRQRGEADRGHGEAAPEHVHHLGINWQLAKSLSLHVINNVAFMGRSRPEEEVWRQTPRSAAASIRG